MIEIDQDNQKEKDQSNGNEGNIPGIKKNRRDFLEEKLNAWLASIDTHCRLKSKVVNPV